MIKYLFYTLIFILGIVLSIPITALLLLTPWKGCTTIFGNTKWGRGNIHPSTPTKGYWQEYCWLVLRNPVNNLCSKLTVKFDEFYYLRGDEGIIDQKKGGYYYITMTGGWEVAWVLPYGPRCFRGRLGWKILGNKDGSCDYVCSIVPFMHYRGYDTATSSDHG